MNLPQLAKKAATSKLYRKLLSRGLNTMVPFNKPHGFKVLEISDNHLKTMLPYKKRNLNHLKGLHACALATLAEITSGFLLISKLDPKKFRIILKSLKMNYHWQAKMGAIAEFKISDDFYQKEILNPIEKKGQVLLPCEVKILDMENHHLATGIAEWQIKDWTKTKAK